MDHADHGVQHGSSNTFETAAPVSAAGHVRAAKHHLNLPLSRLGVSEDACGRQCLLLGPGRARCPDRPLHHVSQVEVGRAHAVQVERGAAGHAMHTSGARGKWAAPCSSTSVQHVACTTCTSCEERMRSRQAARESTRDHHMLGSSAHMVPAQCVQCWRFAPWASSAQAGCAAPAVLLHRQRRK